MLTDFFNPVLNETSMIRENKPLKPLLITIDGPAGAGKTTVSRQLAMRLGYTYLDTGALYRSVAYEVLKQGIDPGDDDELESLCNLLDIRIEYNEGELSLFSGKTGITHKIRTPEISMMASTVSASPVVRRYLMDIQRSIGLGKKVVAEGRDMGTVVFPDADIKFYLDASVSERARRRFNELGAEKGQSMEKVTADMKKRDTNDTTRKHAPLKPAQDAVMIDSTGMNAEAVVSVMMDHIYGK